MFKLENRKYIFSNQRIENPRLVYLSALHDILAWSKAKVLVFSAISFSPILHIPELVVFVDRE